MDKELSLTELYKLLSEGKKAKKQSWVKGQYIHIVDNILKDNFGRKYYLYSENDYVECKKNSIEFDDLIAGKVVKTNLNVCYVELSGYSYTYKVVYKSYEYVCVEEIHTNAAYVLYRDIYIDLSKNDNFLIEEVF